MAAAVAVPRCHIPCLAARQHIYRYVVSANVIINREIQALTVLVFDFWPSAEPVAAGVSGCSGVSPDC